MNIAKAYTGGFLKAAKMPRMLFILYFANIFCALLLALPFMGVLKDSLGQSRITEDLIEGFDYTAFSNLMYYDGQAIFAILGGIKWFVLGFFLMSVFLTGGIIGSYQQGTFTTKNFFGAGAYNFFRFLGLNLLVLAVQLIFLLIIYSILISTIQQLSDSVKSELTLYNIAIGGFIFHGLLFLLISMTGDYGKFYLVLNNSFNVFKAFGQGVKYVFRHFIKTYLLYLFLLFLPAVIMYLYLYLERDIKMATGLGILMVFLMQQAFIFLRNFLRAWILGSQYMLYESDFKPKELIQPENIELTKKAVKEEKTAPEQKKQKTEIVEQTLITEKTSYQIDFSSTFSPESKAENNVLTEEPEFAEKDFLKVIIPDQENEKSAVDKEKLITNEPVDPELSQNIKEEHFTYEQENQEEIIAEKMMEQMEPESDNIDGDQQQKSYLAGETVDFENESQIENQLAEKLLEESIEEQYEEKMIDESEKEGTIIEKIYATDNDLSIESSDSGEYNLNENLDSEAFISGEPVDSEYDIIESDNAEDDIDSGFRYEIIEQNVKDEDETNDQDVDKNRKGRMDKDDEFSFEL